jgi:tetratricopeptide (TPR) repeat protein
MSNQDFRQLLKKGIAAADEGNTLDALVHLESAARIGSTPTLDSYLGYCIALERRQFKQGTGLCRQALLKEPEQAVHYLNLGRVFLAAKEKRLAITTFQRGLKRGRHRLILEELKKLGVRKSLVVPFLSRSNPLNKVLGKAFTRLQMR